MNKVFFYTIIVALIGLSVVAGTYIGQRSTQKAVPNSRIARIDSLKIKNTAKPFVRVRGWFEHQCQQTQAELTTKIHSLQKTYEWLKVLKKDEKGRARHEEFRQEVAALERTVQERKDDLTRQFGSISQYLEEKLKQIIAQLAREKGASLVLNQFINEMQSILYASDEVMDITEDVIFLMNQETQNLHLPEFERALDIAPSNRGNPS